MIEARHERETEEGGVGSNNDKVFGSAIRFLRIPLVSTCVSFNVQFPVRAVISYYKIS